MSGATWRGKLSTMAAPLMDGEVPSARREGPERWDKWLLFGVLGLLLVGLAMVYSATSVTSSRPTAHVERHAVRVILGLAAFAVGLRIDYHRWGRWAPRLYLLGIASLALVHVPGLGHTAGHARRWLSIGGFTLQPSDFARLGLIIYLAFLLSKPKARLETFHTGTLPCLVALVLVAVPVVLQPNLSTTLALFGVTGMMLIAGRIPWKHLGLLVIPPLLAAPLVLRGYQSARVANWLAYWSGKSGLQTGNYQMDQSILAIGSGGFWGRGLGESRQKWFFLPDAHTDFIFAIVGEELGFLGAILVVTLIALVLWRAFEAARRAPDRFGYLLAVGIGGTFAVYAGVNLMVATGMFPTTGLPLPLVSYGGTSVLVTLFSLGILNNISAQGDDSLIAGIGE